MKPNRPTLSLIDGDRSGLERQLVRLAACGPTEELRAALARYAYRAPLKSIAQATPGDDSALSPSAPDGAF